MMLETVGSSAFKKAANEAGKMLLILKALSKSSSRKVAGSLHWNTRCHRNGHRSIRLAWWYGNGIYRPIFSSENKKLKPGKGYYGGEISDFGVNRNSFSIHTNL